MGAHVGELPFVLPLDLGPQLLIPLLQLLYLLQVVDQVVI